MYTAVRLSNGLDEHERTERRPWPPVGMLSTGLLYLCAAAGLAACVGLVLMAGTWSASRADRLLWLPALGILVGMACCGGLAWLLAKVLDQHQRLLQLVADLRRARWEAERAAVEGELLAAMHERTRVARDVHDGLGHILTGLRLKLELASHLCGADPERGRCELREGQELVQEAMQELRRSLLALRAPLPDLGDLACALTSSVAEMNARSRLAISLDLPGPLPELAPRAVETLWRVTREALTNVERHAAAASASVQVALEPRSVVVRVLDDGSGIAPSDFNRRGHYGIVGMRERVESCGGALLVTARPEGGTCVEARIPLAAGAAARCEPAAPEGRT